SACSVALRRQPKPIMIGASSAGLRDASALRKVALSQNSGELRTFVRALYHLNAADPAALAEGFELAQWAMQNYAAEALSSMSARFAKGNAELPKLVREQQDLLAARDAAYRELDEAAGKADTQM